MPSPVEIDFAVGGIRDVLRAFETLESRMERAEKTGVAGAQAGASARRKVTKEEVDFRGASFEKIAASVKKSEDAATKITEAETKKRNALIAKARADADKEDSVADGKRLKAVEDDAKRRLAVREYSIKMEHNAMLKGMEADRKTLEDDARRRVGIRENSIKMEHAAMLHGMEANRRAQEAEANREAAFSRRMTMRMGTHLGSAGIRSIGSTASAIGMLAATTVGIGGGFAVAGALRDEVGFERAVAQTSNAAFVEGDPKRTRAAAHPAMIAALAKQVQAGTNIDKLSAVNALHRYVDLGSDLSGMAEVNKGTGRTNAEEMARLAKGSGKSYEDLMVAAGYLKAQNQNLSPADLNLQMRQVIGAAKRGDINLGDMARVGHTASAFAGQYAGNFGENQAKLMGLAQIAGRVADPAEAAMAVNHLSIDLQRHADKTSKFTTDKSGKLIDPADIIANIFEQTGGDAGKMGKLGIGNRSLKLLAGSQPVYEAAEAIQKGSGVEAVRRDAKSFESVAYSQKSADEDFEMVMKTTGEQFEALSLQLKEVVATAGMPVLIGLLEGLSAHKDDISSIIKFIGSMARAMIDHPIGSILLVFADKLAKDLASAAIAKTIENGILDIFRKQALLSYPIVPPGGGGGAVQTAEELAAGAGAVTLAKTAGKAGIGARLASAFKGVMPGLGGMATLVAGTVGLLDLNLVGSDAAQGEQQGKDKVKGLLGQLGDAEKAVRAGTMSPAEGANVRSKVQAELAQATKDTGRVGQFWDLVSVANEVNPLGLLPGSKINKEAGETIQQVHKQDEVVSAQKLLTTAIERLTTAMNNHTPPPPQNGKQNPTGVLNPNNVPSGTP